MTKHKINRPKFEPEIGPFKVVATKDGVLFHNMVYNEYMDMLWEIQYYLKVGYKRKWKYDQVFTQDELEILITKEI